MMTTLENFNMLDYHQMEMDVATTVIDLSGRVQYDVEAITRELWKRGIRTRDDLADNPDTDMFWAIVADHEIEG